MKNCDKVLVGFLVAAGLFSVSSAVQYVKKLSDSQKAAIYVIADNDEVSVGGEPLRIDNGNKIVG